MVGAESSRRGRTVGIMLELKHATHHDSIGLPLDEPLLRELARHGLDDAWARVTLMSFETTILWRLAGRTRLPIIQLLESPELHPADLVAVGDDRSYGDLATPEGLARIDDYADGIGPHKSMILPRDGSGAIAEPSTLVRDALGDMAAEVRALLDAGVDGVITDHPEVALRAAREAGVSFGV